MVLVRYGKQQMDKIFITKVKQQIQLPVSMKVTYKLDGKKMKLKNMLGKKGKVEIQIDYTNNEKQDVDGKELYVPFCRYNRNNVTNKNRF